MLTALCVAMLTACGGGADLADEAPAGTASAMDAARTTKTPISLPTPGLGVTLAAVAGVQAAQDAATSSSPLPMVTTPSYTSGAYGATDRCRKGYLAAGAPKLDAATALKGQAGVTYSTADLARWQSALRDGPFIETSDYANGSPGDAARIAANAAKFLIEGEPLPADPSAGSARMTHGTLARDAAFTMRMKADANLLAAVRRYLISNAVDARNDFSAACFVSPIDQADPPDAYLGEGDWLLRLSITYDFARPLLAEADRLVIERYLLAQAHYLATHADWYLAQLFPERLSDNYGTRLRWALGDSDESRYFSARHDTNGDCRIDASDDPRSLPVHAYARDDGTKGPRITQLSRMYNNRRSVTMAAVGIVGELLSEPELINRSVRYFREWLTYSVYPDGSQGEFERGGEYCIAKQGVIYSHLNTQSALLVAKAASRRGDRGLLDFATRAGLFGTEADSSAVPAKSLATVVQAAVELANGERAWYLDEPWKTSQAPRLETSLSRLETNFMRSGNWIDSFNELGYLASSDEFPALKVREFILRLPSKTTLRFPGSSGLSVGTGAGTWTDALNAMPAVLLLRP